MSLVCYDNFKANSRPICSTKVSTNKRNIHHRPALLWRF